MALPEFIFGGDTGLTYDQLKQRRAIANALAARQRKFPTNIGEGLTYLGESIGDVLGDYRLRGIEKEYQTREDERLGKIASSPDPALPERAAPPPPASTVAPQIVKDAAVRPTAEENIPGPTAGAPAPLVTQPPTPQQMFSPPAPQPAAAAPGNVAAQAAAGFKATPAYMRDVIARHEEDPTMRGYYGALVAGEAPQGAHQVSPTGARGPFQFTGGTGGQYGLVSPGVDRRDDPDASMQAVKQLTRDNVMAFMRVNGRTPTAAELSLMHQQGGVTGAKMIAGTGNAPARNLAVNNIDPALGPQEAAKRVMAYYGMPNAPIPEGYGGAPQGPRDAIAQALTGGARMAALPGPATDAAPPGAQPMPAVPPDAENPPTPSNIQPVPVRTAQIGPPTNRFAPAGPQGSQPSTELIPPPSEQTMVDPGAKPPDPPKPVPLLPKQQQWLSVMNSRQSSDYAKAYAKQQFDILEKTRTDYNTRIEADYVNKRERWEKQRDEFDKFTREADDRRIEQMVKRQGLEKTRADLEKAYYEQGLPRVQAAEKADLDIKKAARELAAPDKVSAGGTQFERPYAPGEPQQPYAVPPGLPAAKEEPLTEAQAKGVQFVLRVKPDLDEVDNNLRYGKVLTSTEQAVKNATPLIGNQLVSPEYRRARDALGNWGAGFMSHVSGAAITPSEADRQLPAFIPRPGDTDQELLDKAKRRRAFTDAVEKTTGKAGLETIRKEVGEANDDYMFGKNAQKPPVQVRSPAEAATLPPGQQFTTPDGKLRQVPRRKGAP